MRSYFILIFLSVVIVSCSEDSAETDSLTETNTEQSTPDTTTDTTSDTSNDSASDQTTDQTETANLKYLKEINYTDRINGPEKRIYIYSNGLLIREYNQGILYYYEYDNENRIISEKYCDDRDIPENELESHTCIEGFINTREFIFQNDQITTISIYDGENYGELSYDDRGNLISLVWPEGVQVSEYFTYNDNNEVITTTFTHYTYGTTYTYEFDDKKNPFNSFWSTFSFKEKSIDISPFGSTGTFFKENPTKVYKNNVLQFEASYNYDSDGYPISCSFIEYLNDGSTWSSVITFEYVQ